MKRIAFLAFSLFALVALPLSARAAESASVRVMLVYASNAKGAADPRLGPYEAELQRNLPESSFRLVAEGSGTVGDRPASVALAEGHRVEFKREGGGGRGAISLGVQWMNGGNTLVRGTMHAVPGKPFVMLWRPSSGTDVPLVIVVAR